MSDALVRATVTVELVIAHEAAVADADTALITTAAHRADSDAATQLLLTGELLQAVTSGLDHSRIAAHMGPPSIRFDFATIREATP